MELGDERGKNKDLSVNISITLQTANLKTLMPQIRKFYTN